MNVTLYAATGTFVLDADVKSRQLKTLLLREHPTLPKRSREHEGERRMFEKRR